MYERNTMDYFDGLSIPLAGSVPYCTGTVVNDPQYYSIQFNYSGKVFLQISNGKVHTAEGACAFLTWPGERFTYGTLGEDHRRHHCYVCTCGARIEHYIARGLFVRNTNSPLVSIPYAERFFNTIQQIIKMSRGAEQNNPRAVLLFEDLLLHMYEARQHEERGLAGHAAYLNWLIQEITSFPEKDYDFAFHARRNQVTLIHFRRIFKEHTGFSPHNFLLKMRLRKAAETLITTNLSIKEIALRNGWDDEYYFSRLFKKNYRLSPGAYRKESSRVQERGYSW